MNDIIKAIRVLDDQFYKHPWFACLLKAMVMFDINLDTTVDEIIRNTVVEAIESCEDVYEELTKETIDEEESLFREFLEKGLDEKSCARLAVGVFNL